VPGIVGTSQQNTVRHDGADEISDPADVVFFSAGSLVRRSSS
jgi:hypothetical protein